MGNSSTSRYADGLELYDPRRLLRAWTGPARNAWSATPDPQLAQALVLAARRSPRLAWARARRALKRAPEPRVLAPRRSAGEVPRLLLDADAGPRIRRLAERHARDEADVARLWASVLSAAAPRTALHTAPDGEAAPA